MTASGAPRPLVVFDIGSTLVDGPSQGPARRIADLLGLDRDRKSVLHHALMTTAFSGPAEVAAFVLETFGRNGAGASSAVAQVWEAQEGEATPVAGAAELLAELAAGGVQVGLASNIWPPYLTAVRRHFGRFFDEWIPAERQQFSFRAGSAKPAPELFHAVLRAGRVPPRRAVMVGDSYSRDVVPAAALGMGTVWLLHDPAREAGSLAQVINGRSRPPSLAARSIAELDPETLLSILEDDGEDTLR